MFYIQVWIPKRQVRNEIISWRRFIHSQKRQQKAPRPNIWKGNVTCSESRNDSEENLINSGLYTPKLWIIRHVAVIMSRVGMHFIHVGQWFLLSPWRLFQGSHLPDILKLNGLVQRTSETYLWFQGPVHSVYGLTVYFKISITCLQNSPMTYLHIIF